MTDPQTHPGVDLRALNDRRTTRLTGWMSDAGLDHLVLTGPDHIRYATGYRAQLVSESVDWYAAIVGTDGEAEVFVPFTDIAAPEPDPALPGLRRLRPAPSWAPAACQPGQWARSLTTALSTRHARRVGYDALDADILHDVATDLPGIRFRPCAADLFALRAVKDPLEIALVEAACRINAAALDLAVDSADTGMHDHDLLAVAAAHQHRFGAEFLTHSVCNVRKASGGWFADGAPLKEGEPFFLDIGCHGRGGYASDAARTGFVGEPPAAIARAWQHLLTAYQEGQNAARPGVRCSVIHETINAYLARHKLPVTPYGTGHGVGLRCCELPSINAADRMDSDAVLRPGHVIALEPETAVDHHGTLFVLKVEDNFAVTEAGLRRLTRHDCA
ncbi:M24 family metallopeptidase [Streptomyces eurythermus]|uniref:M24 family metallopeptidase n=1 Tax=Streptomyces eurythermus TaxID=42237 RepID=UPI0036D3B7AB